MTALLLVALLAAPAAAAEAPAAEPSAHAEAPAISTETAGPRHPDTVVALLRSPWHSLDPAVAHDAGSYLIIGNVYESLLSFDGGPDRLAPWLATQVPTVANGLASADGLRYAFPIRKGVRFHEGGELTPEDVRHSILREMLIQVHGESSSLLLRPLLGVDSVFDKNGKWGVPRAEVERAIRVEGDRVVFRLRRPFPSFLKIIATWPMMMPKAWAVSHGDWDGKVPEAGADVPKGAPYLRDHANGTGPYRVERADQTSTEAFLRRHDGYWGRKAALGSAFVRAEPSEALRAAMLCDGEADYAYLERPALELLHGSPGIRLIDDIPNYSSGETFFFNYHVETKDNPRLGSGALDGQGVPHDFFRDRDVRAAFAHAFDYETYFKTALASKGVRAAGPVPAGLTAAPGPNPWTYDPARAEDHLRKAWGGRPWVNGFRLTLSYPRGSVRRQIAAELMKKGVEAVNPGFRVDLEALPPGEYEAAYQAHKLPFFIHSFTADYPDPHALAFEFLHSNGYFPHAQLFADAELDRLEESAAYERDAAKRASLYTQLQRRALELAPQIYTHHPTHFKAVRTWLKGTEDDQAVNGLSFANLLYFATLRKE